PSFSGKYFSFSGATFAPRPLQKPHPPIWVGGMPGTLSSPAMRRVAELGDAWHPLGLGLDDLEKGIGKIREMATKAGRRDAIGLAAPSSRAAEPPSENQTGAVGPTPPRLSYTHGEVSFWRPGAQDWAPAEINTPLVSGDELSTGTQGDLELQVGSQAFVRAWG